MGRIFRRLASVILAAFLLLSIASESSAETHVTAVGLSESAGATRLVIDLTERADFRVFLLAEPMRLVIDLPPVVWRIGSHAAPARGVVAGYRFGQFDARTARLVVDLAVPARVRRSGYELSPTPRMHRLVIDLDRVSAEVFATEVQPWSSSGASLTAPAVAPVQTSAAIGTAAAAPVPVRPVPPPAVAPRPAPRKGDSKKIIVLDPGHGGVDPGTIGTSGFQEKEITLAMAREIRRQLEATGRYRVIMTRDDDVFIRLRDRIGVARTAQADLFVSIHADAHASNQTRGASIYTLSETASDAEAAALAARENRADIIAGVDLSAENKEVVSILIDLAQRETMNRSASFAALLVDHLGRDVALLPNNPHRFAGFAVLKAPDIPSALIELGYLSNRHDETMLTRPQHRTKAAAAIVRAIDEYFTRKVRS